MIEFKSPDKTTDLTPLIVKNIDNAMDFYLGDKPMLVNRWPGYYHSYGGRFTENDVYVYSREESSTIDNIFQFDSESYGANWEITSTKSNFRGKNGISTLNNWHLLRNNKIFGEFNSMLAVLRAKERVDDHPLDLNEIGYQKKNIGRHIYYKDQPAIIDYFSHNEPARIFVIPDGIENFRSPAYIMGDDDIEYSISCWQEDYGKGLMISIFDPSIWWFRN